VETFIEVSRVSAAAAAATRRSSHIPVNAGCPSCHQKRVLLFAEWLDTHILEPVSHAQYVFTIPKLLRPIFKYHRRELGLLCKSAWQALREMFQEVSSDSSALPGVVLSVQSYGDRLNLHP
jgi:hypothetical protein